MSWLADLQKKLFTAAVKRSAKNAGERFNKAVDGELDAMEKSLAEAQQARAGEAPVGPAVGSAASIEQEAERLRAEEEFRKERAAAELARLKAMRSARNR